MNMQKCKNCGSSALYNEVSIMAKQRVNGKNEIFGVQHQIDDFFEPVYCSKCGWSDDPGCDKSGYYAQKKEGRHD